MKMKGFSAVMITVVLPFLVGGAIIGAAFGGVGYYITNWFGLFERQIQHEMVFWLFLGMGVFAGTVGAVQSLIAFIRHPGVHGDT